MDEANASSGPELAGGEGQPERRRPEGDPGAGSDESSTFARCARCAKAEGVDRSAGTLICGAYNMRVNAEADEIPDDCVEFSAAEKTSRGE